jgi:hypothetical protein
MSNAIPEDQKRELLPVQQMEAYAFRGDPEDRPLNETEKVMRGVAILLDPLIAKITAERYAALAELATARQTIERLSAPVSDAECGVVTFRIDSGHTLGAILDALITARKDANDKEKA